MPERSSIPIKCLFFLSALSSEYREISFYTFLDRMILDALLAADPHFVLTNSAGQQCKLSEACEDIAVFSQLTDEYLMRSIQFSRDPKMEGAQTILRRIAKRQLYKVVG